MPVLAATLADRLLIARSSASLSGRVDVSPRCVTLLQPLLMGWATLTARGFLPGVLVLLVHVCTCTWMLRIPRHDPAAAPSSSCGPGYP